MEIAIISGKGGTGKSSVSAAFTTLSQRVVLADCDVDAANMPILFHPDCDAEMKFEGSEKAVIDSSVCSNCGLCVTFCRFDAILVETGKTTISVLSCDGCELCSRICRHGAITMIHNDQSRMFTGTFRNGKMVYGFLAPGEENSGKLVCLVREKAREMAQQENIDHIIIDGPPGISCPVISSITGADQVIIVTEPSISGALDLTRAVDITRKFNLKTWVLINKYDLNSEMARQIEKYCQSAGIRIIGKLLFDPAVVEAMVHCKSVVEWAPDSDITRELQNAFHIVFEK